MLIQRACIIIQHANTIPDHGAVILRLGTTRDNWAMPELYRVPWGPTDRSIDEATRVVEMVAQEWNIPLDGDKQ